MKILLVGQTPPPYGGQAYIIKCMLESKFQEVELEHLHMNFSKETKEMGSVSFYKIMHLFHLIYKTYVYRLKRNVKYIYYPISNAPKVSVYRDVIYLLFTRFLFNKIIFHFHAAGISEELPKMNFIFRQIAKIALENPDLAIAVSKYNPDDAGFLNAKQTTYILYGIPDHNNEMNNVKKSRSPFNILFVGKLNSTKGEGYVIDAMALLKNKGIKTRLLLAGQFDSSEYKDTFYKKVMEYGLNDMVEYLGIITGEKKVNAFKRANVFCFPSFFVSESFGLVLLEAMQFGLPLIASRWRGIQDIVEDGKNGYLVDVKNAQQIADKLEVLITNEELSLELSKNSRQMFLEKYTLLRYIQNLETAFLNI